METHDPTSEDRHHGSREGTSRCGYRSRHARRRARKERVLHTRISDSLAEDIRRIAEDLRVPTSNLVRNVLEEVFDVVESVSDDVGGLFEEVLDEADAARSRIAQARSRSRRRRAGRRRDEQRARDRAAWEAARDEVERVERATAASGGSAPPPLPIEWYWVEAGRAAGPLRGEGVAEAVRSGRLQRDSLVWSAGMPDWLPAGDVTPLAKLFSPPPVPGDAGPQESNGTEPTDA